MATKWDGYKKLNSAIVQKFHECSSHICDVFVDNFLYIMHKRWLDFKNSFITLSDKLKHYLKKLLDFLT